MNTPQYEALNASSGLPYLRPAQTIDELPTPEDRKAALIEAITAIAEKIGLTPTTNLKFGQPVFCAFKGMTRASSKNHPQAKLLLTMACDTPLEYCASYTSKATH